MKKEDIRSKLDIIPENLQKLELFRAMEYDEFQSDFRNIDSTLHRLQTSIQALVDIGGYIIANPTLRDRYISMIQFRNRIVHLYNDIDRKVLFRILQEESADIRELYRTPVMIIEENPE